MRVSVREVRENLSKLLDAVEKGQHVEITRNGKQVARLVGPAVGFTPERIAELRKLAKSVRVKGKPLSQIVIAQRRKARL